MEYIYGSFCIFGKKIMNWSPFELSHEVPRIEPKMPWYHQYWYFYNTADKIDDNLYLGSSFNAYCQSELKEKNINVIINVSDDVDNFHEGFGDIIYYKFPISDNNSDDITDILLQTNNIIDTHINKGHNILVHCYMGASRSATVVINYIMNKYKITYEQAKDYVSNKRPLVNLSEKFDNTLKSIKSITEK
jgi:protein tyrosine/serine phosphatase